MQKYKVKPGCCIEDGGKRFGEGTVLELSKELALFHAENIESVGALATQNNPEKAKSKSDAS